MQTQALVTYLGQILNDEGFDFWTEVFLLRVLNEARVRLPFVLPLMTAVQVDVPLQGGLMQSLPAGASLGLIRVEGLVDASGLLIMPLRESSETAWFGVDAEWQLGARCCDTWAKHGIERRAFWLSGNAPVATSAVRVWHTALPAVLTSTGEFVFAPEYESNLVDFVLARAYEREGTAPDKAQYYLQKSMQEIQTTLSVSASAGKTPGTKA